MKEIVNTKSTIRDKFSRSYKTLIERCFVLTYRDLNEAATEQANYLWIIEMEEISYDEGFPELERTLRVLLYFRQVSKKKLRKRYINYTKPLDHRNILKLFQE